MNTVIALLFTLTYVGLVYLLAAVGSVHGPSLFPVFELVLFVVVVSVLWWLRFSIPRRYPAHPLALLSLCGTALGGLFILLSFASEKPLNDWDFHQMQKRAAAIHVFNMRDEDLLLQNGMPIGIRLKYSMRFPDDSYYWQSPFLYPQTDIGYGIGFNIVQETIEPAMRIVSAVNDTVADETAHLPAVARKYGRDRVYNFTVDMVPDFLALSADRNRLCIVKPPKQYATAEEMITSEANIAFKIAVSGTNYSGVTQNTYRPKLFYQSAIQDGATECKYSGGRITFK